MTEPGDPQEILQSVFPEVAPVNESHVDGRLVLNIVLKVLLGSHGEDDLITNGLDKGFWVDPHCKLRVHGEVQGKSILDPDFQVHGRLEEVMKHGQKLVSSYHGMTPQISLNFAASSALNWCSSPVICSLGYR